MDTQTNTRAFRATLAVIFILTLVVFTADALLGSGIVDKEGVTLTSFNLAGIPVMLENILPSLLIGIATLVVAMFFIGKLLGQNWRDNVKAMLDNNNNDSTFVLAEKIAVATTFVAMSVTPATWYIWLTSFAIKAVVMMTLSIIITTVLCLLIMAVANDPKYRWYQVDRWWIDMMNANGNDMIARLTGSIFFIVGITMLGVLLVAQL